MENQFGDNNNNILFLPPIGQSFLPSTSIKIQAVIYECLFRYSIEVVTVFLFFYGYLLPLLPSTLFKWINDVLVGWSKCFCWFVSRALLIRFRRGNQKESKNVPASWEPTRCHRVPRVDVSTSLPLPPPLSLSLSLSLSFSSSLNIAESFAG